MYIVVGSCLILFGGFCVWVVVMVCLFVLLLWFFFMYFCFRFICYVWFGMYFFVGLGFLRFSDSNWICMLYKIFRVGKFERFLFFVLDFFFEIVVIWCSLWSYLWYCCLSVVRWRLLNKIVIFWGFFWSRSFKWRFLIWMRNLFSLLSFMVVINKIIGNFEVLVKKCINLCLELRIF